MRVLVIFTHPSPDSFAAGIKDEAMQALAEKDHEVRLFDLYKEGFNPLLSSEELASRGDDNALPAELSYHLESLQWAEALIFIHPTWWAGPPAMLKGWLDRVWRPGVVFTSNSILNLEPGLPNIKRAGVITTMGSPRPIWWIIGQPGRRMLLRGLRECYSLSARSFWMAMHSVEKSTEKKRKKFLAKVHKRLRKL